MRDTWFGDNRDLVKWGTLAHIAEREDLAVIVQVLYFRTAEKAPLHYHHSEEDLDRAVWNFFRDVTSISNLGSKLGREIVVVTDKFNPNQRTAYRQIARDRVARLPQPKVVLLDPDTGIAPSKCDGKHATLEDIRAVWDILNEGDWLVVYQHASRSKHWRDEAKEKLAQICGVDEVEVSLPQRSRQKFRSRLPCRSKEPKNS